MLSRCRVSQHPSTETVNGFVHCAGGRYKMTNYLLDFVPLYS